MYIDGKKCVDFEIIYFIVYNIGQQNINCDCKSINKRKIPISRVFNNIYFIGSKKTITVRLK